MCIIFGLSLREPRMTMKGFRNTSVSLIICIIVGRFVFNKITSYGRLSKISGFTRLCLVFSLRHRFWYSCALYQHVPRHFTISDWRDVQQVSEVLIMCLHFITFFTYLIPKRLNSRYYRVVRLLTNA